MFEKRPVLHPVGPVHRRFRRVPDTTCPARRPPITSAQPSSCACRGTPLVVRPSAIRCVSPGQRHPQLSPLGCLLLAARAPHARFPSPTRRVAERPQANSWSAPAVSRAVLSCPVLPAAPRAGGAGHLEPWSLERDGTAAQGRFLVRLCLASQCARLPPLSSVP
jgi:hypothetical protein